MFGNRWTHDKEDIHDHCVSVRAGHSFCPPGVFSCPVLRLVNNPCGAGPEEPSRVWAPASRALGVGPSRPQPLPRSLPLLQLLVGRRRGLGLATEVTLEQGEDGRARHLPAPLSPRPGLQRRAPAHGRVGRVASRMNGLICPRTAGMNLSVGAGERGGLNEA